MKDPFETFYDFSLGLSIIIAIVLLVTNQMIVVVIFGVALFISVCIVIGHIANYLLNKIDNDNTDD